MVRAERSTCAVVGVGASAGGLDALRRFLGALPADPPFALVVVQHLDPTVRSQLAEIIDRACPLTVKRARSGDALAAGTVYVVPEGREPFVDNGRLRLRQRSGACREPIDALFTSLAAHNEAHGCGVLLSGNGSDGVLGLRQIRGAGGMTFAQEPSTAEYPSMPATAIQAGVCDFVGSPEQIAHDLMAHVRHPSFAGAKPASRDAKKAIGRDDAALAKVLALVRADLGMDFSGYKKTTVMRRVARRAMLKDAKSIEEYRAMVEHDPEELAALLDDLLINVTEFFRDADVFEALRTAVLPGIIEATNDTDTIRIWAVGCSTGEEVYSLLITALEALDEAGVSRKVTIFGTDASEMAIRRARAGVYPPSICTSVSPERLSRYFVRTAAGFEIERSLRDMCVFARQDITKDTPFSRLDLVSLRNVLIYMDQPLQGQVLAVAHFALRPEGVLLLGTSETPEMEPHLFRPMDKQHHVYRRQDVASRLPVDVAKATRASIDALSVIPSALAIEPDVHDAHRAANELSLLLYAPPRVVVDVTGRVLHFFGDTAPFLEHASGRATLDVNEMAHPGIALELKDALDAAAAGDGQATRTAIFTLAGRKRYVSIEVTPLPSPPGEAQLMVAFREIGPSDGEPAGPVTNEDLSQLYESREQRVRGELGAVRGRLRAISEEKEQVNQSLRSANEEIRSSNEELQSINEELETAKEELQSANEELITVNDELRSSNRELGLANDDLTNFTASLDMPVLMLDRSLRVRRFTPQAARVVRIEDSDVGRLLGHLRLRVEVEDLPVIAASVIESGEPRGFEVHDEQGCWYAMALRPYLAADGAVDGVVIAFTDVDELKRGSDRLERRAKLSDALTSIDADLSSTMDLETIMQCALDEGVAAIGADAGTVETRHGDGWILRYQNGFGPDEVGLFLTDAEAPIASRVALVRTPLVIADMQTDEQVNVGFVKAHALKSVLAVPLIVRDAVMGCLLFYQRKHARGFTASETDFGRRLGTSVSLALENSRLLHAEQESTQRAETLNAVNRIIRATQTPAELLARLVGEVSIVAGAEKCLVIELRAGEFIITHVRNVRDDLVGVPKTGGYFPGFALATEAQHPVLIADTWADPRTNKDFVVPYDLRAMQLLPLVVDGVATAVVALAYGTPREFTAADEEFSERICTAMSVALGNAVLLESETQARHEAKRQLERTQLLQEVATAAGASLSLAEIGQRVLDAVVERLGVSGAAVYALDEARNTLRALSTAGYSAQVTEDIQAIAVDEETTVGHLVLHRLPFMTHESDYVPPISAERVRRIRGEEKRWVAVSIRKDEEVLGLISLLFDENRPFDESELSIYLSIAETLGTAFDNVRLFEAEQAALLRVAALHELTELATSSLDLGEVADRALHYVHDNLGVGVVTFWLLDETGDRIFPVSGVGFPQAFYDGFAAGIGLQDPFEVATAVRDRRSVVRGTADIGDIPEPVRTSYARFGVDLRALLVLPVRGRVDVIGAVTLAWDVAREFSQDDIRFFSSVANELAIATENARLFQTVQVELARTTILREVAAAAAGTLDVRELSERALSACHERLGAKEGNVYLFDSTSGVSVASALFGFPEELAPQLERMDLDEARASARSYLRNEVVMHDTPGLPAGIKMRAKAAVALADRWVSVPIRSRGEAVGSLGLVFPGKRAFRADEIALYQALADQLGVGLDKARLFAAEVAAQARATQELETTSALLDAAGALSRWTSLADVAHGLATAVLKSTAHTRVIVSVWEEATSELVVAGSAGEMPLESGERWPLDRVSAAARSSLAERRTKVWDLDQVPVSERGYALDVLKMHLALYVPLVQRDRVVGLLIVDDPGARAEFGERDIQLMEGIAAQAAVAIENARLVGDLQDSQYRVSTILQSISDGFYALDREWRFTYANAEAARMIGVPAEDLIGHTIGEVLGNPDVQAFQEREFAPAMSEGTVVEFERYFTQTGIWADIRAYPSAEGVAVYGRDITERKIADIALQQARERTDLMAALLEESSQPFGVGNLDGSFALVNRAFETLTGYPSEELGRQSWATTLTAPEFVDLETERLAELVRTGQPVRYEKEIVRKDGTRVPIELLVHLAHDDQGAPRAYYSFVTDLSGRKESERLDALFNELRTSVSETLDYSTILRVALAGGAEAIGSDAAEAFTRSGGGWSVTATAGTPRTVDAGSTSDTGVALARLLAAEGGPLLVSDVVSDERMKPGFARKHGIKSLLAVPLGLQGSEIGFLAFYHSRKRNAFTALELEFVTRLARVVALAIQNSMLYERERNIAETLQDALLTAPEQIDGIETAYVYRAASSSADVGGDFCEVFALGGPLSAIVVGDVSGKGIEAARLTSLLHDGIRAYALETSDPSEILARLNKLVRLLSPTEQYATVFLGVLDTETGRMKYCTAGHPSPAIVSASGATYLPGTRAPLLGAFEDSTFACRETTLAAGDRLVAFTDGVTEARHGRRFLGEDRLLKMLGKMTRTPVGRLPQRLFDRVLAFADGVLRDDTVILAVELTPGA